MPPAPLLYPDWKAPRGDAELLIWPEPRELLRDAMANRRGLDGESSVLIHSVPLPELRRSVRQWLGHDADQRPLIVDGHQAELHHAGVWAKRVLADALATRLDGHALHFAIDTDAPKHLDLRWIGGSEPITDDTNRSAAHWTGQLNAPSPAHLSDVQRRLDQAHLSEPPVATDFLASLRRLSLEEPTLPAALTNAMHELDWSLGLRHHALLAGPLWESEPYLLFASHLIVRAGEFAQQYNAALSAYRRAKKVRSTTRPMPDLASSAGEWVELPFWIDHLDSGDRTRPRATARDGGYLLRLPSGADFFFPPAARGFADAQALARFLRAHATRLSPRALTLTLFLRLCCADQFIHGIGGGEYDQVADRIIASHFGIAPPSFAVATATLYLPEAVGRSRSCVSCVEQEGHRLKHSLLGPRKRELVERIAAAPRRSPERYAFFADMHRQLSTALATDPKIRQWEQRLREAQAREQEEAAIFDRELFYALQPRHRLQETIERFRQLISAAASG